MRSALPFLCGAFLLFGQGIPVNPPTALTVMVDGAVVGTTTTLNLVSGPGIVWTQLAAPAGQINVQAAVNTATIVNKNILQSGVCSSFFSSGGQGSAYVVSGAPNCQAVQALNAGAPFLLVPDVTNTTSATLKIDNLGPYTLTLPTGAGNPILAGTLQPGQGYWMWFDGTVIRLVAAP